MERKGTDFVNFISNERCSSVLLAGENVSIVSTESREATEAAERRSTLCNEKKLKAFNIQKKAPALWGTVGKGKRE